MRQTFIVFAAVLVFGGAHAATTVQTIAGNGANTDNSDGSPATSKSINFPLAMDTDAAGNVFVCTLHQVRKITTGGVVSTVAGTGVAGFSGDGGLATAATLRNPRGVAIDTGTGDIYISDTDNHRIRRVANGTNIITTVAGNGTPAFNGDGAATTKSLNQPMGLDYNGGLYIADSGNHVIRFLSGGTITTIIGNGGLAGNAGDGQSGTHISVRLARPTAVVYDGIFTYFCDSGNNRIRQMDMANSLSNKAGDPLGSSGFTNATGGSARFLEPLSMSFDGSSVLYIAEAENNAVRALNVGSGAVTTFAGTGAPGFSGDGGAATSATLRQPAGAAFAAGTVYIADSENNRIRKVTGGTISTFAGNGTGTAGGGPAATAAALRLPEGLWITPDGTVFIADTYNHLVSKIDTAGNLVGVAGNGTAGFSGDGGLAGAAQLNFPQSVFVDGANNVFIADTNNQRIRRVDGATGIITTVAGTGVSGNTGDGGPAVAAQLHEPTGLTGDKTGTILFVDRANFRLRKFIPGGAISAFAGTGTKGFSGDGGAALSAQFGDPVAMAFEPTSGNFYVVDAGNHRIRRIAPGGIITTIAGTGAPGFSGDNGAATSAMINDPSGVVADPLGNVFFTDRSSHRVRVITNTGIMQTIAGTGTQGFNGDGPLDSVSIHLNNPFAIVGGPKGLVFSDFLNNRIRALKSDGPAAITVTGAIGGIAVGAAKTGVAVTFTAAPATFGASTLTYVWDFGDGTTATGNPVTKTYAVEGTFNVSASLVGLQSGTGTLAFRVFAPNSGGAGVNNVVIGKPELAKVTNPLNGLSIEVVGGEGGVLEFFIDINSLTREAFTADTDFNGIGGRVASSPNSTRPTSKFSSSQIFVAESTAKEVTTGAARGKARKMVVISKKELGSQTLTDNRSSTELALKSLKGKFLFKDNGTGTAKNDTVTFTGKIKMPGGLDISQEQELWLGIGNIVDTVTIGPKGRVKLPSQMGRLKKVSFKYPRLKGTTITAGDEDATVSFTISTADMDTAGFDTEGISRDVVGADSTPVQRNIQVGMLLSGMSYQSSVTTEFKTSKPNKTTGLPDTGQMASRQ